MRSGDLVVVDAGGEFGVDVVVVEGPWTTQGCAEVCVQGICAPECAPAAFSFDLAEADGWVWATVPVQADGEGEMRDCAEEAPAVVDSGLREEIAALCEACLDAC